MKVGQMVSKYRLLELLGVGGMGEVWRAVDSGLTNREVAIKFVKDEKPELLKALAGEARALSKIPHHQNMVVLYDVLEEPPPMALIMEYIPGVSLTKLVEEYPNGLPWELLHQVLSGLLAGMSHAHKHNMIHRDLKPDNVLIAHYTSGRAIEPSSIKILDFGLARMEQEYGTKYTRGSAGTFTYMSPEQLGANEGEQGPFTDVYALGLIAYELITGRPPFGEPGGENIFALVKGHTEEPPPSPSQFRRGLAPALEQVLLRALAKRGADRFPDAAALARVLLPLIHQSANQDYKDHAEARDASIGLRAGPQRTVLDAKQGMPNPRGSRGNEPRTKSRRGWKWIIGGCLGVSLGLISCPYIIKSLLSPSHGSIAPEVVKIKGGTLKWPHLKDVAPVNVPDFQISKTHVTVTQFRKFVQATKYDAGKGWDKPGVDDHPVTDVSYGDAVKYVEWLSRTTGDHWHLPSEEQYEYAASNRGQGERYPWGKQMLPVPPANLLVNPALALKAGTTPVAKFPSNQLGLHDMLGSAWIWTSSKTKDGSMNYIKGGAFDSRQDQVDITTRSPQDPTFRNGKLGFRVCKQ